MVSCVFFLARVRIKDDCFANDADIVNGMSSLLYNFECVLPATSASQMLAGESVAFGFFAPIMPVFSK